MKNIKRKTKTVCSLVCLVCSVYVISKLQGYIHLNHYNNGNSAKNGKKIFSNSIFDSHMDNPEHGRNEDLIIKTNGIQTSVDQIKGIKKVLPPSGNLLVWGLGNDSPYWHNSTNGKVIFIEDDSPLRKAGVQWYDKIMQTFPFLEAYRVHYKTHTVKSFSRYLNTPNFWHELDLFDQLPEAIIRTHWHVIFVDAPLGCCGRGPGRYQSIYTSWKLAKKGTHIFVDDFERKVEHELSMHLFGKPQEVIKRQNTEYSKENELAYFIINLENLFSSNYDRISSGSWTEYDNINESVIDNSDNGVKHWSLLLTVNNGFFDFFNNWRLHFIKLNISLPMYVIAEDNMVYYKLTNITNSGIKVKRSEHITINTTVHYNSYLYKKMVSARPSYVLSFLQKGMDIIYSDIDSVWLNNPLHFLTGNFDIWSQMDSKENNNLCTGFLAIKRNRKTLRFIKDWQEALKESPKLNQPIFNTLIQKSSLHVKALDSSFFPSGKQYFDQYSDEQRSRVIVVHNNWIIGHDEKLKRFKKLKLWLEDTQIF